MGRALAWQQSQRAQGVGGSRSGILSHHARYAARGQRVFGYPQVVSPTILRIRGFRFYFFSREETRAHVHVQHAQGEAKFWLEPEIAVAHN